MLIGPFYHAGLNVWTTQEIKDTIQLEVRLLGKPMNLTVAKEGELFIAPVNETQISTRKRDDFQAYSQILNIMMNKAMTSVEGMCSMGKRPRFFDYTKPLKVEGMDMQVWEGFKTSAYMYNSGCVLIVDSCHRFMSTKSVLDIVREIYDKTEDQYQHMDDEAMQVFQQKVNNEVVESTIVTSYGKRQTYKVALVDFENGPC